MQEPIALKGTGFSPYVKSSNGTAGFSPWANAPSN
jgi:hypothetical protein